MTALQIDDYLRIVGAAYDRRGGLEGQRTALKTKTGITIRNRLIGDVQKGAVIPPVVVGVLASAVQLAALANIHDNAAFLVWFSGLDADSVSIIDGMQRTTALLDAVKADQSAARREMRVEFWISEHLNSLIYRMLVLNTGQVPWELARQLETVYSQFMKRITAGIDGNAQIFNRDDRRRRYSPAQYQSKDVIELLLIFTSRKVDIDVKDKVSEDFARLDAIETSAHHEFIEHFVEVMRLMARLDVSFGRLPRSDEIDPSRIDSGKDIFSSFPAMAGFTAAASIHLFDEPGFDLDWGQVPRRMNEVRTAVELLVARLDGMSVSELREFMQLELLEQRLSGGRRGGVGRFERDAYRRSFAAMIKHADRLPSMAPCWRA